MKETFELRIPEDKASRYLEPDVGRRLGGTVRLLQLNADDPLLHHVAQLERQFRAEDSSFFLGWDIKRRYTKAELEAAELLSLSITATFEPPGEMCGTEYDESSACKFCGAGRRQVSDLILDLRKVPGSKDVAGTIADEWIVSQRLAEIMADANVTGDKLRPVHHKARHRDDAMDLTKVPSGRQLIEAAEQAGAPFPTWGFWVWLNRPEQAKLSERATEEYVALAEVRDRRQPKAFPVWYQLVVTSRPVQLVPPTRFGVKPLVDDADDALFRCPLGHVGGLNLLSELYVSRDSWDGSDWAMTEQLVGRRVGVLVPRPLLLISPRLRRLFADNNIRGYSLEVAHPV